jgi:hypothetical protein
MVSHMVHVRPAEVVASALRDSDAGMQDADNAAKHGVAVKTIRRWRRLYQRRGLPRGQEHTSARCPRCDGAPLAEEAYAELLGWYLGDGWLENHRGRGVYALHIYNDERYPEVNAHILDLMRTVKPCSRPHTRRVPGCQVHTVSWRHWPCLFPQHGPGRKHERPLSLEPWQQDVVEAFPGSFVRGLFHSDGCRVANWTTREVAGVIKRYDYGRWQFVNNSTDIQRFCTDALDQLAIPWRQSSWKTISVSRRAAVEVMDRIVGPKS